MMALEDPALQLANGDPLFWVALKDHAEDVVQFIRQRQDGLQEPTIPGEGLIRGILHRSLFPWVATARQVDQYHAE